MSDDAGRPKWNTGPLWGILLLFLLLGTVGAATFVYGLLDVLGGNFVGLVAVILGGLLAFVAFLFLAGILYRVDRYRGANLRRMEIFE